MRRQEVVEQLPQGVVAEGVDPGGHLGVVIALIAEVLPHMRPVALLDAGVVVLAMRADPCEEHRLGPLPQIGHPVMVDKLAAVVAVQSQQRKRQALFPMGDLRQGAALTPVFQGPQFSSQPGPASVQLPRMGMLWRNRFPERVLPRGASPTRNGATKRSRVRALALKRPRRTSGSIRRWSVRRPATTRAAARATGCRSVGRS